MLQKQERGSWVEFHPKLRCGEAEGDGVLCLMAEAEALKW